MITLAQTLIPGISNYTLMWIVLIALSLVSMLASNNVQRKFKKYSQINTLGNITGREVAEQMLRSFDIHNVTVQMVQGTLTDHYNPANHTLNLSPDVYNGTSVAAAAVAAHECGHAVQHAVGYSPLRMRSALVPVVSFASRYQSWVILAGLLMVKAFPTLLLAGIVLFALTTLFSLVTLPVEIDASRRAIQWLELHDITTPQTKPYAVSALRSAANTYVMLAVTSLATLAYYIMIYMDRR